MNTRAQSITSDFFNTLSECLRPGFGHAVISGNYSDTPPDTITDEYSDVVKLGAYVGYIPVATQEVIVKWSKTYREDESPDDVDPVVDKVLWLANPNSDDLPHYIDVTDLLKTQMDINDLIS